MNYQAILINRCQQLEKNAKTAEKMLSPSIQETSKLQVSKQGKHYRYYFYNAGSGENPPTRSYVTRAELPKAAEICQQEYLRSFIKLARQEIHLLKKLLQFSDHSAFSLYDSLHPGRKKLVKPALLSDQASARAWLDKHFESNNTIPFESELYSEKGEQVRSKSEKIIADKLYQYAIPYKYEAPLFLKDRVFFPDFTIFDPCTRTESYWEHFGLIDKPDYQAGMIRKLEFYARSGIVPGVNLIITLESSKTTLSTRLVDEIIQSLK